MKLVPIFCSLLLLTAGAVALAGEPVLECDGQVVAPGQTVRAAVTLTNDTDRPMKVRINARVRADRELGAARANGKREKARLRLEPGETVVEELELTVPEGADGPMVADLKVRGRGVKARLQEGLFADGEDPERPDAPEVSEFSGTVTLAEEAPPALTLDVDGTGTFRLVGPEACLLGKLMAEEEVTEVDATIEGIELDPEALRRGPGHGRHLETDLPIILVLGFDAEGIEDPRDSLVMFHHVFGGPDSEITEAETAVIDDEESFAALLERAGVELPQPPKDGEGEPALFGFGHDRRGRWGPMPLPPAVEIDFDAVTLLAVFAGEVEAGTHVRVLSVTREDEGGLTCRYAVEAGRGPGPRGEVTDETSSPFVVVAIEKTDEEVTFVLVE